MKLIGSRDMHPKMKHAALTCLVLGGLILLLLACGKEQYSFPSSGCGAWEQTQWSWCGGTWVRPCKFGEMKCLYSWTCGYQTGPVCTK